MRHSEEWMHMTANFRSRLPAASTKGEPSFCRTAFVAVKEPYGILDFKAGVKGIDQRVVFPGLPQIHPVDAGKTQVFYEQFRLMIGKAKLPMKFCSFLRQFDPITERNFIAFFSISQLVIRHFDADFLPVFFLGNVGL